MTAVIGITWLLVMITVAVIEISGRVRMKISEAYREGVNSKCNNCNRCLICDKATENKVLRDIIEDIRKEGKDD